MPRGPQDMRLRWPQDPPQEPVEPTRWNPPSAKCIDGQNDVPAYAKRLSSPLPFTHLSLLHSQLFILPQLDRIECIYVYTYILYIRSNVGTFGCVCPCMCPGGTWVHGYSRDTYTSAEEYTDAHTRKRARSEDSGTLTQGQKHGRARASVSQVSQVEPPRFVLELRHAAPPWRIGHGKVEIGRVKTLLSPRMASKGLKRCRDLLLPSCSFDELARERTERERGGEGEGERERERVLLVQSNRPDFLRTDDDTTQQGLWESTMALCLPTRPFPSPLPLLASLARNQQRHSGFCFTVRLMQSHVSIAKCYSSWEAGGEGWIISGIGSLLTRKDLLKNEMNGISVFQIRYIATRRRAEENNSIGRIVVYTVKCDLFCEHDHLSRRKF